MLSAFLSEFPFLCISLQSLTNLISSVRARSDVSPAAAAIESNIRGLLSSTATATAAQMLLDSGMTPSLPSANHPVMRLINERLQEGSSSSPGQRRDGCKLGLVVEGGGMRGIVTGAMLMGLQDMGLTPCFDAIYGASAGAINSTYFLTGVPRGGHYSRVFPATDAQVAPTCVELNSCGASHTWNQGAATTQLPRHCWVAVVLQPLSTRLVCACILQMERFDSVYSADSSFVTICVLLICTLAALHILTC